MYPDGAPQQVVEDWLQQKGVWTKLDAQLRPVLTQLWMDAYTQGLTQAKAYLPAFAVAANVALLMSAWLTQIIRTTISIIAKLLIQGLPLNLDTGSRIAQITVTEVNRAIQQGKADAYTQQGVTLVRWVTGGPDPCPLCIANQAQGPHPLGTPFSSGALTPPQHPNCRCHLEKA